MPLLTVRPWFTDRGIVERSRQVAQILTRHGLGTLVDHAGMAHFAPRLRRPRDAAHGRAERLRMALGFWLTQPDDPEFAMGPGRNTFGHPGAGGGIGFADPDRRAAFGYVTNRMSSSIAVDPRARALIDACYAA